MFRALQLSEISNQKCPVSPDAFHSTDQLEAALSEPSAAVVEALRQLEGDILFLGVAGKMGPTLARMARRASDAAGVQRRIIGVSRFSSPTEQKKLGSHGIETIACDLLDDAALARLPDVANVLYLAGMKFGATGNEALTWAMNTWLPGAVAQRFKASRIAAFSTGNVYGLSPVSRGGSIESDLPQPSGEYAMSCLGRERMFEHFSRRHGTRASLIRLNYASELRYGVLVDLALRVWKGEPIDLAMGYCNVIWQGDANAWALLTLGQAASPPFLINVAGPEIVSVREVASEFARRMEKPAVLHGTESETALLSNSSRARALFGSPRVRLEQMIAWVTSWIIAGGELLAKPTHFESRDGRF